MKELRLAAIKHGGEEEFDWRYATFRRATASERLTVEKSSRDVIDTKEIR